MADNTLDDMEVIPINCDMCGKETNLYKTDVEGSVLSLCNGCSKFGKVIATVRVEPKRVKKKEIKLPQPKEEETILSIVSDYGNRIKNKREKIGIDQEEFAKKINEKKALIHKIETGHFEPPIDLARKIEKFLHINLIEMQEIKPEKIDHKKGDSFTIGDFIKVRKR